MPKVERLPAVGRMGPRTLSVWVVGAEWQAPTARPTELDMHGPRFVAGGDDFAEAKTRDSVTRLRKHLAYAEELDRVFTTRAQDGHGG
ncbi:hypothetical protein [Mycobacteroides chelonae]|nr:hypothetical protein [Mycobacteroides chelonae]QQG85818.1 hypothetical protein HBA99_04980 [Mycobacteroides chelonae]QQG90633.1 hypothetical protein HBA97_04980 [Mycobacteroides chelonae]